MTNDKTWLYSYYAFFNFNASSDKNSVKVHKKKQWPAKETGGIPLQRQHWAALIPHWGGGATPRARHEMRPKLRRVSKQRPFCVDITYRFQI